MNTSYFTHHLRHWRKQRKLSQLELALAADVSQRHVSWLETGKSHPSRNMVLRLSDAMDVPLRERNQLLNAAGYANVYSEKKLDEPTMEPVISILQNMLDHHEPYPAYVLDRYWDIKMQNKAATKLLSLAGEPNEIWNAIGDDTQSNIALLTVHPKGLRRFISNWKEVAGPFTRRLKKEAIESEDPTLLTRFKRLEEHIGDLPEQESTQDLLPVLPLNIRIGNLELNLCSVISTFGTAQDITAHELRIETFYPADQVTTLFFNS